MRGPLAAAACGAAFFVWVHGVGVLHPSSIGWLMRSDWRFQFLGWQFFRQEPWLWPPGLIAGYHRAPSGSAIGLTDSIPLAAFVLKPFDDLLPLPFQYLGGWLLLCFALQGFFGALIVRIWSPALVHQVSGGALFVLLPTLLNRTVHTALCAHWLILWALWLYLRHRPGHPVPVGQLVMLGVVAGLVHPYLAVMVLAIEVAFVVRLAREDGRMVGARAADAVALAMVAVGIGWWASGMFSLPSDALLREGLTGFSMNLLAPISPTGWSALLPEQAIARAGQGFEGFQYLGAGVLVLVAAAAGIAAARASRSHWWTLAPLLVVSGALAFYALSPRITFGSQVLTDYSTWWLERLAVFRVTGRFFWPAAYGLLALALGATVSWLRPWLASAVLCAVVLVQAVDLRPGLTFRRDVAHSPGAARWSYPFGAEHWPALLASYRHLILLLPAQCGASPVSFEAAGYLASLHGLSVNAGEQSRWDDGANRDYCADLGARIAEGRYDDEALYLVHPAYTPLVRAASTVVCGELDGLTVCGTERTAAALRSVLRTTAERP